MLILFTQILVFGIPVDQNVLWEGFKNQLVLLDEGPMLPKYVLQNMNQLPQSIPNLILPFGGKILVAGGNFQQCLPFNSEATAVKHSIYQ